jgi:hypothetical protein
VKKFLRPAVTPAQTPPLRRQESGAFPSQALRFLPSAGQSSYKTSEGLGIRLAAAVGRGGDPPGCSSSQIRPRPRRPSFRNHLVNKH